MESDYCDEKRVPTIHNLKELIEELHKVFDSDRVNVDYVKALMYSYKSNPQDWKQYAKFDEFRYTRNLVDTGNGKFNLIALCWGEGHGSSIHNHMDSHCFMKILEGQLVETNFSWPTETLTSSSVDREVDKETDSVGEPMQQIGSHVYDKNLVTYINDSLGLHRVENPSHSNKAISLHLYSPPFNECLTFDQRTGHKSTAKITFWSKYGQCTSKPDEVNECSAVANKTPVTTNQPSCSQQHELPAPQQTEVIPY